MARLAEAAKRALGGSKKPWRTKKGKAKIKKVFHEWKSKKLHSGSKKGPLVTSKSQATAIALSEARKAGRE